MIWLWWAPLVAAGLHIGEEFVYPGGFADWDRQYRSSIRTSITSGLHLWVNAALIAACITVGLAGMPDGTLVIGATGLRSVIPAALAVPSWLALAALLFSNAIFHLVGTWRTGRYSPGVLTGAFLYVPLAVVGYGHFLATGQVSSIAALVSALLGGSYHLWASLMHQWRARGSEA